MKVYMHVCMCVCICPAACRQTYTTCHPEIWRGLLISPGLGTKPGDNPKCWASAPPTALPTIAPEFLRSICTGLFHNCIVK